MAASEYPRVYDLVSLLSYFLIFAEIIIGVHKIIVSIYCYNQARAIVHMGWVVGL